MNKQYYSKASITTHQETSASYPPTLPLCVHRAPTVAEHPLQLATAEQDQKKTYKVKLTKKRTRNNTHLLDISQLTLDRLFARQVSVDLFNVP